MELRQLRYFVAVAEDGNISRAAKRIFLTQPALSRQIKGLEAEIGQCLLERQAHSIRLTPAGEALLREARDLPQHADQVLVRVRGAGQGLRLRVGYAPSLAAEYGGAKDLMAAVQSSLGVALVTTQMARLFPKRVRLVTLSAAPEPACIAVGHRAAQANDKPFAVFIAELRTAAAAYLSAVGSGRSGDVVMARPRLDRSGAYRWRWDLPQ